MEEIPIIEKKQTQNVPPISHLDTVAVVGSGIVGRSWAIIFARAGYKVKMYDALENAAASALPLIHALATDLHSAGLLRKCKSSSEVMHRISVVKTLEEALDNVFWAQECVPETLESKKKVFQEMEKYSSQDVILASSSSAIPPSLFTNDLPTRNRCMVAHPVNPPHLIPLVELVPSPYTDAEVVRKARQFMEEIGQSPIAVKRELEGFILNRIQGAVLNEAFKLVEDGYISAEDLDRTMKDGLGLRWSFMGPFETIDLNAPGGVADYVQRYGNNMHRLAKQQAHPRKWEGEVVDQVTKERREILKVEDLPDRIKWRDTRLMALMTHKLHMEKAEEES